MATSSPEIAPLTEFAVDRLLPPESTPGITLLEGGHLQVVVDGEMVVRLDAVAVIGDGLKSRRIARRIRGESDEVTEGPLAALEGRGAVIFPRRGGGLHVLRLRHDLAYFRESALWAFESSLRWEHGLMPGTRGGEEVPLVRLGGDGLCAVHAGGSVVTIKVTPERPQRIAADALIGWIGSVVVIAEGAASLLRCEGEGAVLVELAGLPSSEGR
ncbi:MAG: AIM24 family protein [Nannocystaceae bacterium]